jgi:thioredoxin-related protein
MLSLSAILLTFAPLPTTAPWAAPNAPDPAPSSTQGDLKPPVHGRLDWFQGSFDELLAEAKREGRIVFLDFWANWCGWCKRLDQDVFSDHTVVGEMKSVLCFAVDKDSKSGGEIARRYGVGALPTLIFLDEDSEVLDVISGYLSADKFLARTRQIKRGEGTIPALRKALAEDPDDLFKQFDLAIKLRSARTKDAERELSLVRQRIARGEGFDTESIDDHWRLAQAFDRIDDRANSTLHIQRVEELDRDGTSFPMRSRKLRTVQRLVEGSYTADGTINMKPLYDFIATEPHQELKFRAWRLAVYLHGRVVEEARKRDREDQRAEHQAAIRAAERQAWRVCPPDMVASFGHDLAWSWYVQSDDLTEEELAFAVEVAQAAAAAAPASANHLDTLACCLYVAGETERAVAMLERAMELDPQELRYRRRLIEFRER